MEFKKFSESEIIKIYDSIKNNNSSKYDVLDDDLINFIDKVFSHPNYKWDTRDYPRVRTILDFKDWIEKYNIVSENLAYTHIDDPELKIIKYKNSELIEYNRDNSSGDLHLLNYNEKYDFFLFNQTLEHLYNPFMSVKNIYNSLKDGGYVFTSVPVFNIPHCMPTHFNGFTPIGLAMLFKVCGFDVLEVGCWGNFEYISKLFSKHRWPGYRDLTIDGLINEEKNAVSCWILAKK